MTDPDHPLIGSRVTLTSKTPWAGVVGEVAIIGIPTGETRPWALIISDSSSAAGRSVFAYPLGGGHFEPEEAVDVAA